MNVKICEGLIAYGKFLQQILVVSDATHTFYLQPTAMPLDREITRPMLGTDQEPTSRTWKSSLRSTSPSPRSSRQSRSRTRSNDLLKSSLRSRTDRKSVV